MKNITVNLSTGPAEIRIGRNTNPDVLLEIAGDKKNAKLRTAVVFLASQDAGDVKDSKGVYPRDRKFFTEVAASITNNGRLPAGKRDQVVLRTLRYGRQLTIEFGPKKEVQPELPVIAESTPVVDEASEQIDALAGVTAE